MKKDETVKEYNFSRKKSLFALAIFTEWSSMHTYTYECKCIER